ncbi:MAG TPA: phosphonate ABC transporter, permease protein PhnE, partial [Paracoccus sp.]|nr:phosphonate ABC transporter, permease protein PhnE [Paracoccus sp. (in: a-proteobacteria)]
MTTGTTLATPLPAADPRAQMLARFRRRQAFAFAVPVLLLAYLAYVFVAFDIPGTAQRVRTDNATMMLADAVGYKIHVTQDNRRGGLAVSYEGSRRATFAPEQIPGWIRTEGARSRIELGGGHVVTYDGPVIGYEIPDYGRAVITVGEPIALEMPLERDFPGQVNASDNRVVLTTGEGRLTVTRSRADTFRYFPGWELFFFDLRSPFQFMTWAEIGTAIFSAERVYPEHSNLVAVARDFWTNSLWRHGE